MSYYYDIFGWYVGESGDEKRFTDIEPINKSLSTNGGDLRSNWTGVQWEDMQYVALVEPEQKEPVPDYVTKYQAELHLYRAGLLDGLKAAVDQAGGEVKIAYDSCGGFFRNNDILNSFLKNVINMTDDQIDQWFIDASKVI